MHCLVTTLYWNNIHHVKGSNPYDSNGEEMFRIGITRMLWSATDLAISLELVGVGHHLTREFVANVNKCGLSMDFMLAIIFCFQRYAFFVC